MDEETTGDFRDYKRLDCSDQQRPISVFLHGMNVETTGDCIQLLYINIWCVQHQDSTETIESALDYRPFT